jgi:transcriptional antiterminator RfaH
VISVSLLPEPAAPVPTPRREGHSVEDGAKSGIGPTVDHKWYVCHTKPRCEKRFASLMADEQFEHLLPLYDSIHVYRGRKRIFKKPIFTSYVFVRVSSHQRTRIFQRDLLVRAIVINDYAVFVQQLESVRLVIASGNSFHPAASIVKGRRVKIIDGPLYGVEGMVDAVDPGCVVVCIDVLRQGVSVKLPQSSIELL